MIGSQHRLQCRGEIADSVIGNYGASVVGCPSFKLKLVLEAIHVSRLEQFQSW